MNRLGTEKRTQVVSALVEGNSIRATCRMTGASKNTVTRLLARINLRFDRNIRLDDLDAEKLAAWLGPLVDASSLDRRAAFEEIPEEFRQAAEEGTIVVGMSKKTVFAILGAPKDRSVDAAVTPPVEKWIYEPDAMTTLIVTIEAGVVTKVDRI